MKKLSLPLVCILTAALIIAITGAIIFISIGNYGSGYSDKRAQEIKTTIMSNVAQCYALEGKYPSDLEYLEDHYGLQLDHKNYSYHYDIFASNIFPNVRVFPKGE
jgi:hypothetical protein